MTRRNIILNHEPDGYACNMGWVVREIETGVILYRGPEWAARYRYDYWSRGLPIGLA